MLFLILRQDLRTPSAQPTRAEFESDFKFSDGTMAQSFDVLIFQYKGFIVAARSFDAAIHSPLTPSNNDNGMDVGSSVVGRFSDRQHL